MRAIRDIVVPVDLNDPREDALRWAIDLAGPTGARIHLIHVYQMPVVAVPEGQAFAIAATDSELLAGLTKSMEALVARHRSQSVRIDYHLVRGLPHLQIPKLARALSASLIVMGTHARRGVDRLLLGSTTEKVMRHSPAPVLVVPPGSSHARRAA